MLNDFRYLLLERKKHNKTKQKPFGPLFLLFVLLSFQRVSSYLSETLRELDPLSQVFFNLVFTNFYRQKPSSSTFLYSNFKPIFLIEKLQPVKRNFNSNSKFAPAQTSDAAPSALSVFLLLIILYIYLMFTLLQFPLKAHAVARCFS